MRDAYPIMNEKVEIYDKTWTITQIYIVPDNPTLYVELSDGCTKLNSPIKSVVELMEKKHQETKIVVV